MRSSAACAIVALLAAPVLARQPGPADERAVRDVIARYTAARNARDAAAIEALFTADADQLTTAGQLRRGRGEIRAGTSESSSRNPGTRRISVDALRFITADVAIADGPYEIGAAGEPPRRMWTTIVVVRTAEGWRIAAIRNMTPASAP